MPQLTITISANELFLPSESFHKRLKTSVNHSAKQREKVQQIFKFICEIPFCSRKLLITSDNPSAFHLVSKTLRSTKKPLPI